MPDDVLDTLRKLASEAGKHAYTPYSNQPVGVIALLSDGVWVAGVRVENASFPLTIPALTAAYSTARCAGRDDLIAVVQSRPFRPADLPFLEEALGTAWSLSHSDVMVKTDLDNLPALMQRLDVDLDVSEANGDDEMVGLATEVAGGAHIPESGFPVGCVVTTDGGTLIPGCNVEHLDWTRGLCAERIAVATARAYGHHTFRRIFLSCPHDPAASPCGACRQVLFELAPGVPIVMSRGPNPPETTTPEALLPGGFRGDALRA